MAPPPAVVTVSVRDTPPADLLACPEPARAFPVDQGATLPPDVRDRLKGLALAHRDLIGRLLRLIDWAAPGSCADSAP